MSMITAPLGARTLPKDVLARDKKECRKIGPCGLGEEALYVGSRFLSRYYYIPWGEVRRVFKRVAMSAGGYTGKGVFGSMAYLVVQFGGQEHSCNFRNEAELDQLLAQIEAAHPQIPTHSAQADRKLAEAAAKEKARYVKDLSPEAENTLAELSGAKRYLEARPEVPRMLTATAKQKRVVDQMKPSARILGAVVGTLGLLAAVYGLYGLLAGTGTGMYFLLGGGAAFFFIYSASLFPGKWNSKKYALSQWEEALEASRQFIAGRGDFPTPPQYAHPVVLDRMMRVVREGRAHSAADALTQVKADLKALNASVTVSQQEHDEVVEIKPMFLVCDYQD